MAERNSKLNNNTKTPVEESISVALQIKSQLVSDLLCLSKHTLDEKFIGCELLNVELSFTNDERLKLEIEITENNQNKTQDVDLVIEETLYEDFVSIFDQIGSMQIFEVLLRFKIRDLSTCIIKCSKPSENLMEMVMEYDEIFLKENIHYLNLDKANIHYFLNRLGAQESLEYCDMFTDRIVESILSRLEFNEVSIFLTDKTFKYHKQIYERIRNEILYNRFLLYNSIQNNSTDVIEIKRLFKKLVPANISWISNQLRSHITSNPLGVIKCMIDALIVYDSLIPHCFILMDKIDRLFIEIFYNYSLERLKGFGILRNNEAFSRQYLSLIKFINYFRIIDMEPIYDFIYKNLRDNIYLHLPMIEIIYDNGNEIPHHFYQILDKAPKEIFSHGEESFSLKMDMANRYYQLCKKIGIVKEPESRNIKFEELKTLLPEQIKEVTSREVQDALIESFLKYEGNDFYTLKNLILLVRFHDQIQDSRIKDKLTLLEADADKEIKVLIQSCLSVLQLRTRKDIGKQLTGNEKHKEASNYSVNIDIQKEMNRNYVDKDAKIEMNILKTRNIPLSLINANEKYLEMKKNARGATISSQSKPDQVIDSREIVLARSKRFEQPGKYEDVKGFKELPRRKSRFQISENYTSTNSHDSRSSYDQSSGDFRNDRFNTRTTSYNNSYRDNYRDSYNTYRDNYSGYNQHSNQAGYRINDYRESFEGSNNYPKRLRYEDSADSDRRSKSSLSSSFSARRTHLYPPRYNPTVYEEDKHIVNKSSEDKDSNDDVLSPVYKDARK